MKNTSINIKYAFKNYNNMSPTLSARIKLATIIMKPLLTPILLIVFCLPSLCQNQTIPKLYKFLSENEEWMLRIFDFKTFELFAKKNNENYSILVEGKCLLTDSTIQLKCDSSASLDLLLQDTSYGLNIKELIRGNSFEKVNDYIIPKVQNAKYQVTSNVSGSYFQQIELNMGGTKIEFNKKNLYTLTEYSCQGHWTEKGHYSQSGNIVSLKPNKKTIALSSLLMDPSIIFVTDFFLITKKEQSSISPERFSKEEVFLYFLKM
jgi:hypothetical protein